MADDMGSANLSQELSTSLSASCPENHVQETLQEIPPISSKDIAEPESNFAGQNQEKLGSFSSKGASLSDLPSGSFECPPASNDSSEETGINDASSFSGCDRIQEVVEVKEKKQDCNRETSGGSCEDSVVDENGLLDAKKKQLLAELEAGSIFKNKTFLKEGVSCLDTKAEILEGLKGVDDSVRHSLNIEMIDDTALIGPVLAPKNFSGGARIAERNGNQETNGKKAKRSDGKGNSTRKVLETSEGQKTLTHVCGEWNDGAAQKRYSRKEMEALKFVNVVEQKNMWRQIFSGLANDVVQEYKALANLKAQKNTRLNCYHGQHHGRREGPPIFLGELSSKNDDNDLINKGEDDTANLNVLDPLCISNIEAEDAHLVLEEGESSEEYDSDEDYTSIQKPAFLVEGEPDFDSGPPEDGLEYLRRVRWEAAHIPKVKVAKRDNKVVRKEQSVYMPQIPDIARCPDHLLPSEQWECAFLADFSELRQLLSFKEGSSTKISSKRQTMAIVDEEGPSSSQLSESILVEKLDNLITDEIYSCDPRDDSSLEKRIDQFSLAESEDSKTLTSSEDQTPKNVVSDSLSNFPSLTAILAMDSVARVSMLRKRISAAETMDTLSKNDCVWLFSLCAAVDTPLDADTCAALRSLLRKCASWRATKSELDDDVIMLNILATISGRYFGQSGS